MGCQANWAETQASRGVQRIRYEADSGGSSQEGLRCHRERKSLISQKRERVCPTATITQGNKTNKQRQTQPTAAKRLKKGKRRRKEGKKRGRETTRRGKNEKEPQSSSRPGPTISKTRRFYWSEIPVKAHTTGSDRLRVLLC